MEIEEVETIVTPPRADSWAELQKDPETGKISGFVVSGEFRGRLDRDRQVSLWNNIRRILNERATEVGTILLYTPEEYEAMTAVEEAS